MKRDEERECLDDISHDTKRFAYNFKILAENFAGRKKLVTTLTKKIDSILESGSIVCISGKSGTGKSSLAANIMKNLERKFSISLIHSFGLFEGSDSISSCLFRICVELVRFFRLNIVVPEDYA